MGLGAFQARQFVVNRKGFKMNEYQIVKFDGPTWAKPMYLKRAHYYVGLRALCGKTMFNYKTGESIVAFDEKEKCFSCRKNLEKLRIYMVGK